MWIAFQSSQCCDQLQLPTPHLSADKPLAVPYKQTKNSWTNHMLPNSVLSYPEKESRRFGSHKMNSSQLLQLEPRFQKWCFISSAKASGSKDHRDERRQEGEVQKYAHPISDCLAGNIWFLLYCPCDGRQSQSRQRIPTALPAWHSAGACRLFSCPATSSCSLPNLPPPGLQLSSQIPPCLNKPSPSLHTRSQSC